MNVRKQIGYVTWLFQTERAGVPFDPTLPPVVQMLRVDPASGALALDVNVGAMGLMTVSRPPGYASGVWAATANLSGAVFEQYWLVASFVDGVTTRYYTQQLYLSDEDQMTYNQARVSSSAQASMVLPPAMIPGVP